jgi:hypothetical protein
LAPSDPNYWKREYLAYASGLLAALPPGLRAPRCVGASEPSDDTAWLWLEDQGAPDAAPWSLARYRLAARHAGQLNGAYLTDRPLPAIPWLSAGVARWYVERWGTPLERLPGFATHPLVRRQYPAPGMTDRLVRLWREREVFLAALARLPRTLAHLDAFRANLFAVRGPAGAIATVAVDWAFLGRAAVGEEIVPLVSASVTLADADPGQVRELGEEAFAGYVAGLRDAGWTGDAGLARLGYTAGMIRYGLVAWAVIVLTEPETAALAHRAWGRTVEDVLDRLAALQRYTLDLADEARARLVALP